LAENAMKFSLALFYYESFISWSSAEMLI